MRNFTTRIQNKANALSLRARMALSNQRGDFYISDAVKIIIAVVLLATSLLCLVQVLRGKEPAPVYNKNELMVILGGGGIIIGCYVIGLNLSCLLYLFLWLKVIEKASWKAIIIIEVFMAALILGVFVFWMQVQFPMGLFAYLM